MYEDVQNGEDTDLEQPSTNVRVGDTGTEEKREQLYNDDMDYNMNPAHLNIDVENENDEKIELLEVCANGDKVERA